MKVHAYDKILNYLSENKATYKEIADATGLSYSGVKGRVTELRRYGYAIEKTVDNKIYIKKKRQLIPFKLHMITAPGGEQVLTMGVPIDMIGDAPDREQLKSDFEKHVNNIKDLLKRIEKNRKTTKDKKLDVELNWEIGNIIESYQADFIKQGFYCYNYETILEEIIKEHRREFWRVRKEFVLMYPNKKKLVPWGFNTYNEIIVVKDLNKRRELFNFVKKEFDKTGKPPNVTTIREKRWELMGTQKGRRGYPSLESDKQWYPQKTKSLKS